MLFLYRVGFMYIILVQGTISIHVNFALTNKSINELSVSVSFTNCQVLKNKLQFSFNSSNANSTKWSNTLKQSVGCCWQIV